MLRQSAICCVYYHTQIITKHSIRNIEDSRKSFHYSFSIFMKKNQGQSFFQLVFTLTTRVGVVSSSDLGQHIVPFISVKIAFQEKRTFQCQKYSNNREKWIILMNYKYISIMIKNPTESSIICAVSMHKTWRYM